MSDGSKRIRNEELASNFPIARQLIREISLRENATLTIWQPKKRKFCFWHEKVKIVLNVGNGREKKNCDRFFENFLSRFVFFDLRRTALGRLKFEQSNKH